MFVCSYACKEGKDFKTIPSCFVEKKKTEERVDLKKKYKLKKTTKSQVVKEVAKETKTPIVNMPVKRNDANLAFKANPKPTVFHDTMGTKGKISVKTRPNTPSNPAMVQIFPPIATRRTPIKKVTRIPIHVPNIWDD